MAPAFRAQGGVVMELLLTCGGVALVIVAFSISDYLDAKAKALRPTVSDNPNGTESK